MAFAFNVVRDPVTLYRLSRIDAHLFLAICVARFVHNCANQSHCDDTPREQGGTNELWRNDRREALSVAIGTP